MMRLDESEFYDLVVDEFMDDVEENPPDLPLSPFHVYMIAIQFWGVSSNGGPTHGILHYANSEELHFVEHALKIIGESTVLNHIRDSRDLINGIDSETFSEEEQERAFEKLDKFDNDYIGYDDLEKLISSYYQRNYEQIVKPTHNQSLEPIVTTPVESGNE